MSLLADLIFLRRRPPKPDAKPAPFGRPEFFVRLVARDGMHFILKDGLGPVERQAALRVVSLIFEFPAYSVELRPGEIFAAKREPRC